MKLIILTFFIAISICTVAQVKKRDQGVYKGLIASYEINTGQELIEVDSSEVLIKLEKSSFSIKIRPVTRSVGKAEAATPVPKPAKLASMPKSPPIEVLLELFLYNLKIAADVNSFSALRAL